MKLFKRSDIKEAVLKVFSKDIFVRWKIKIETLEYSAYA